MFVYLKPNAISILSSSQEFFHAKDNTIYHKGFPICYRLKNGPRMVKKLVAARVLLNKADSSF